MADDGLQFDKAEFEAPPGAPAGAQPAAGPACAFCGRPLTTTYWAVADQVSCGDCRERWHEALTGGSGGLRFARAAVFGLIAAALGAVLSYAVARLLEGDVAFMAIVIGLMVGWGVRRGADYRGGGAYQALAVGLTYIAISLAYVPIAARALEWYSQEHPVETQQPEWDELMAVQPRLEAYVVVVPITLQKPFLGEGTDRLFGIIIVGIGLFEAWRMNKRVELPMSGPHAVGPPPAASDGAPSTTAQAPTA